MAVLVKGLIAFVLAGLLATSLSCPNDMGNVERVHEEPLCIHSEVNVSSTQTLNPSDDTITVNYTVTRNEHTFIPITVDIYRGGVFLVAFRCKNGSIIDGGAAIVQVIFGRLCEDPIVTVNRNVTVSISLDLHLRLSDPTCSTVTIGPQRLELFLEKEPWSGQLAPFVRLLNVDTCNRTGPAVPIRLSTSMKSSIVLFPDGRNETVGDISVRPLSCSDNHTQVYRVFVPSEEYTLYGGILSLMPLRCINVPVSGIATDFKNQASLYGVVYTAASVIIVLIVVVVVIAVCYEWRSKGGTCDMVLLCVSICIAIVHRKCMGGRGVYETRGSDSEAPTHGIPEEDRNGKDEDVMQELAPARQPRGKHATDRQAVVPVNPNARPSADKTADNTTPHRAEPVRLTH